MSLWRRTDMPRTIAVTSQKGGIGKTTTASNLALAWGALGLSTLAIDLDPQFALTRRFGSSPADVPATVYELLTGEGDLADAIVSVGHGVNLLAEAAASWRSSSCRSRRSII